MKDLADLLGELGLGSFMIGGSDLNNQKCNKRKLDKDWCVDT